MKRSNLILLLILAGLILFTLFTLKPTITSALKKHSVEKHAVSRLRELGYAQIAYQERNNLKAFGSLEALQKTGHIGTDYTLENLIPQYYVHWSVWPPMELRSVLAYGDGAWNVFTIIAWPRDTRPGLLSTFAISEDQKIRVYTPSEGSVLDEVHTWVPIH